MSAEWGIIFDFDGVIAGTMNAHYNSWQSLAKIKDKPFSEALFLEGIGVKNTVFIRDILQWSRNPLEIAELSSEKELFFLNQLDKVALVPGICELLKEVSLHTIPIAIGSSSPIKNITRILKKYHLLDYFSEIISAESITRGKPFPEVFQKAAFGLQLPVENCVVVEDAYLGIEAAKRAGCKAIALTTTFKKECFLEKKYLPDIVVHSIKELSIEIFNRLFSL